MLVLVDDSEGNSITRVALRLALDDGVDVKRPESNQKMRRGSIVLHTAHVVPWLTCDAVNAEQNSNHVIEAFAPALTAALTTF